MGGMEEDLEPLLHSAFRYALALTHEPAEAQDLDMVLEHRVL